MLAKVKRLIFDWPAVLSIGEQQRLSFVRLLALFIYTTDHRQRSCLVMLDESTSAINIDTELQIYKTMVSLGIWYVTISHRQSLIDYHHKHLKLHKNTEYQQSESNNELIISMEKEVEEEIVTDELNNPCLAGQQSDNPMITSMNDIPPFKSSSSLFHQIKEIWSLIHLPFDLNNDDGRKLRRETYLFWLCAFIWLGVYCYLGYRLATQTGTIFQVLGDYAGEKITIDQARSKIKGDSLILTGYILGVAISYSLIISSGQIISSLYTKRQLLSIGHLLFQYDTMYHSKHVTLIPNMLSHDLHEFNTQLFHFLFGSIYYNGILGTIVQLIPYTALLLQHNGKNNTIIIYVWQIVFMIILIVTIIPFYRSNVKFETYFSHFVNQQKRVELQSEQIVLSDRSVMDTEQNQLKEKLAQSFGAQIKTGLFYGLYVGISSFSGYGGVVIKYAIPSALYFYFTKNITTDMATSIITLTVYSGYIQNTFGNFNSLGQPFTQLCTLANRVITVLAQLKVLNKTHHHLQLKELELKRRIYVENDDNILSLINVNIRISQTSHLLIQQLNFVLESKTSSLIITGPSGCGKSSLLRLLAGLNYNLTYDNDDEELTEISCIKILSKQSMLFLPQQIHLIEGTLREQLSYLKQAKYGVSLLTIQNDEEEQSYQLLKQFNLHHLIARYTWDTRQLWSKILSVGEQQRLIIVCSLLIGSDRIKCFVLDETTSGCDEQTERSIYNALKQSTIQYITVSHRHELIKYHTHQLTIDPKQQIYKFQKLC
ncbi:unnamed protein product [Didymodactylos carnosus]|uniref:AAA+ ATPase domain-containing protein n=1 Tax=Didymodactylos carnosus TaxID=1234261 RepID=A0A814TZZ6_9BILA|nr:unnamed protein product [Didymodactylos carnosus]CAF3931877.1 unnamed protein product [Didymodactylos carnosus]